MRSNLKWLCVVVALTTLIAVSTANQASFQPASRPATQPEPLLPPSSRPASTQSTDSASDTSLPDSPLSNRTGEGRQKALRQFGGTRETERAVADGLAWLAAHQRDDGIWDRVSFEHLCPSNDRCPGEAMSRLGPQRDMNLGVSALATLAFLGAGYTHQQGQYTRTVERAFEYILAQQDVNGSFSPNSPYQIYNDAVATLAVAEAYSITRDPVFELPLRRAVAHLAASQQRNGGWDYTAHRTDRNDTSVTGWVVMALKSASEAGYPPPQATLWRVIDHLDRATLPDGRVWYSDQGIGADDNTGVKGQTRRYGAAMTAVGLYVHEMLGLRPDDPVALRQISLMMEDPPSYQRMTRTDPSGLHSEYYWYYGTLALFHHGGDEWDRWNQALRRTVLEYQERPVRRDGTQRHTYGSWQPYGANWGTWGKMGGRVYSTAINTLTLEIYYRYVPGYLSTHGLIGPAELRSYVESAAVAERSKLVPRVRRFNDDAAEPIFLWLMQTGNDAARLAAAWELAAIDSPVAVPELKRQLVRATGSIRDRLKSEIARLASKPAATTVYGNVTRIRDEAAMLLFDTLGRRVYYGQQVDIMRDGKRVATATVERRFTGHNAAAAIYRDGQPQAGDTVRLARMNADDSDDANKDDSSDGPAGGKRGS